MSRTYMKASVRTTPNPDKPCRCGSGLYCHKHLRYQVLAKKDHLDIGVENSKRRRGASNKGAGQN